jgi:hypothetical protein
MFSNDINSRLLWSWFGLILVASRIAGAVESTLSQSVPARAVGRLATEYL